MWKTGIFLGGLLLVFLLQFTAQADDLDDAKEQFSTGDYTKCVETLEQAIKDGARGEERQVLLSKALLTLGRYPDALTAITNALRRERSSIQLRWQAREVFLASGQPDAAKDMADEVVQRVAADPRSYRDPADLIIFAQAALLKQADPKKVLDQILGAALKANPKLVDVYLVSGNLALDKHDYDLAAKKFEQGLKEVPHDPELNFGLARAYEPSHTALMVASLEAVLQRNSNHVGSLLLLTDHAIDAEDYPGAEKILDQIKEINPWHPDAWAYRAVIAHLQNQSDAEKSARETGLKFWPENPRVDYLIGLKLSQKYRFAEGAARQRQALEFDSNYLPARGQLAHDLLRLGDEEEGWELAHEVHKQDGYDVEAFNVVNLHDTMNKFATLTNRDFLVRMGTNEAALYGSRVLDLLERARSNLCAKYDIELKRPTIIEIFPNQKDFAVRTFGMPGNSGYLGVCFGSVVTANSPAVQHSHPVNWQAVLWHEFCHVVTLQMTKNKMPRWLSEGISVHEELQANPSWGQHMTPRYREMILGGELTPLSKLSGAFMSPESEMHLQFAYYESALVVEFLVQRYGTEKLRLILRDLGEGMEINEAIAKSTIPMEQLETEFAAFAKEKAEKLAPGLDFEKPEFEKEQNPRRGRRGFTRRYGLSETNEVVDASDPIPKPTLQPEPTPGTNSANTDTKVVTKGESQPKPFTPEAFEEWVNSHPTNFWALTYRAQMLTDEKRWPEAKVVLQKLVEFFPNSVGQESAYPALAAAHRALGETNEERQVLARFAAKDHEAPEAYLRLMELEAEQGNWPKVIENAERYLAVNPLVPAPYRFLVQATQKTDDTRLGIEACRALLQLDPPDPAEAHYQLARLLHRVGDPAARRHVLQALEEAPRYREALQLLLEINKSSSRQTNTDSSGGFQVAQ